MSASNASPPAADTTRASARGQRIVLLLAAVGRRVSRDIAERLDDADLAAGRRITCPTLVLYADNYLAGGPLDVWRPWCTNLAGAAVKSGHYLAEENPKDTLAALVPFLRSIEG
jgi:pimeloyl-ACP methyl ester carboxylesterase